MRDGVNINDVSHWPRANPESALSYKFFQRYCLWNKKAINATLTNYTRYIILKLCFTVLRSYGDNNVENFTVFLVRFIGSKCFEQAYRHDILWLKSNFDDQYPLILVYIYISWSGFYRWLMLYFNQGVFFSITWLLQAIFQASAEMY